MTRRKLVKCLGIWDWDCVKAQVASSSKTYFYLKHRSGYGNQSEKAFCSVVTKARAVKADAEVGTEEQQLSIALVVGRKETGKRRAPPKGRDGRAGKDKALLSSEDFLSLVCVLITKGSC